MKPTSLRPKTNQTMTLEKVNEQIDKLLRRKALHTNAIELITKIKDGIESPLWEHIRQKCNELITGADAIEDKADEYIPAAHPIPDRTLWRAFGFRKAAKNILAVENMIINEPAYRDTLIKIEKEIADLTKRKAQLTVS